MMVFIVNQRLIGTIECDKLINYVEALEISDKLVCIWLGISI